MEDNFIDEKYPCLLCNGNGVVKCRVCDGTGENSIYDSLDPIVLKAFEKPYCEACDGKGAITCGRCNGSGMD
jgi:DnaJ-class molecular chaperone